ncbi:hypothetical protein G9A89_019756 [Geosiphon pyriformis]|nr:hypothetical protein G9A89_019756 [Geosiphon pyriformis]
MPKGVFHGSAGGSFSQKKKELFGNVKHSGDEKDISLKSGSGTGSFSDADSLSGDDKNVSISGSFDGSLLDLAVNTPKAKRVNTGANFGSPISSPNFEMDEKVKPLPVPLKKKIPLNRIWVNPKIIKTSVEVAVKKSFALNINLSAVKENSATSKTQLIRKLFSKINGFGGTTTSSKFEGIIRSSFTSSESMEKAVSLAGKNNIVVNSDLKKQGIRSDQAVVIKEILMNTPKEMIIAAASEFGKIKLIKIQLIGIALLFMLPVRTTAHDLNNLLDKTSGRTCIINHLLDTGNRVHCAVVGFESENNLNSAFLTEPVFGGVCLSWTRLDLVRCGKCGRLSHLALEYNASDMLSSDLLNNFNKRRAPSVDCLQLAKLYTKKNVLISRPAAFGGKSWAQVVSLASPSGGSPSGSGLGVGFFLYTTSDLGSSPPFSTFADSSLNARLVSLECFLELLADQVFGILRKLSFVELVPMVPSSGTPFLVGSVPLAPVLDSDMALNGELALSNSYSPSVDIDAGFNSSSSKVLTTKVGGLESKMSALEASFATCNVRGLNNSAKQVDVVRWHFDMSNLVSIFTESKLKDKIRSWIAGKFDGVWVFTSGLDSGCLGSGVAIVMNNSLAKHICKVSEVPGRLLSIRLLFKNKLLVSVLGLYAGASSCVQFSQADDINSLIAMVVNKSSFVVLGGNFNKDSVHKSTSFKKCFDLDLVNALSGSVLAKMPTWGNSHGVVKTIDYMFISSNLINAVVDRDVTGVKNFFDTDHKAVSVSVSLGGLLDS